MMRPLFGFQTCCKEAHPSLRGAFALVRYDSVAKFQRNFNTNREEIKTASGIVRLDSLVVDGKWGDNTNYCLWLWSEWMERTQGCLPPGTLPVTVRNSGPSKAKACLMSQGFTEAEVAELQSAWSEYRARGGESTARSECERRGGTWDEASGRCIEAPSPNGTAPPPPPVVEEGLSTAAWIGIAAAGAFAVLLVYWMATED